MVMLAVLPDCCLLWSSVDVKHSYLNVVYWYDSRLPTCLAGIAVSI